MYKLGSKDVYMVRLIQKALNLAPTGVFDVTTQKAVIAFQMKNNLVADGIVGPKTLEALNLLDTDQQHTGFINGGTNFKISVHHMPASEYITYPEPMLNDYIFLHHTAGWENPFRTIDDWARDKRGKIATEFVIGGQNIKTGDGKYDGVVVQAFPEGSQAYHLGPTGSSYMNLHSVGIEICNFGYLTESLKCYAGITAHESQVCCLEEPFKKFTNWHRYSDKQLKSLKKLLLYISARDNIDLSEGLIKWIGVKGVTKAFGFQQDAYEGKVKGLLSHGNVLNEKSDAFPQPELIDMLLSL